LPLSGFYRESAYVVRLVDDSLALLVHVLLDVVTTATGLACGTAPFPTAEWLVAGPGARGGASFTVDVDHAGFDVVQEPIHFAVVLAVEASGQTIVDVVGLFHRFVQAVDGIKGDD